MTINLVRTLPAPVMWVCLLSLVGAGVVVGYIEGILSGV